MIRVPRGAATAAALCVLLSSGFAAARADIPLTAVATDIPLPVGIDVRAGQGQMIVSVNLQDGSKPYDPTLMDFQSLTPGGAHAYIFPNVKGLTDEQKVTSVRCQVVSAGWTSGDLFTGTGVPGQIIRIHSDGTFNKPWVTIPTPGGADVFRGGLHIDETGIWGFDMLAVTHAGRVFRINSSGGITELPKPNVATPEAINTFPNDPAHYGVFAGKLVIGGEDDGKFYTIGPADAGWTSWDFGLNSLTTRFAFSIEDLKIIRPNSNYYQTEEAFNTVYRASAADLAPFAGDLILVEEVPSRLWRMHWNGSTFEVSLLASVSHGSDATYFEQGNFDEGDCSTGGGVTRTWGFWKTHLDLFSQAVANHCINLGVLNSPGCSEDLTNPTLGQLEAIFWTSPGKGTTALGQARLQLAHQLIAAQANVCMLGTQTDPPSLISQAVAALDGTDTTAILNFATLLDDFNNSGDPLSLPVALQGTKGDPKGSKGAATSTGCAFL